TQAQRGRELAFRISLQLARRTPPHVGSPSLRHRPALALPLLRRCRWTPHSTLGLSFHLSCAPARASAAHRVERAQSISVGRRQTTDRWKESLRTEGVKAGALVAQCF